jgi:cob(I)alamin adenosyltransferase
MLRIAAFAASGVASTATVLPLSKPAATRPCCTHLNTARCVARSIARRVREIVEGSGGGSSTGSRRKARTTNESLARQASPRAASSPSK